MIRALVWAKSYSGTDYTDSDEVWWVSTMFYAQDEIQ